MLAPSLRWIVGRARFTTVLSSITMNSAKHIVPSVIELGLRSGEHDSLRSIR